MTTVSERRRLLGAGLLSGLVSLAGGCAIRSHARSEPIAVPEGFIAGPTVASGESWLYSLINRYNGEQVAQRLVQVLTVNPQLRVQVQDAQGQQLAEEIYQQPWQVLQEPAYGETLVFDRPMPLLPSQLAVGTVEHFRGSYRLAGTGRPRSWSGRLSAAGWERVTTPAGAFDALKIERHIYFEHHDVFRRRARRLDTLWYAPAVNRWVMRDWTGFYVGDAPSRGLIAPGWVEEREDSIRWLLLEHRVAPVS